MAKRNPSNQKFVHLQKYRFHARKVEDSEHAIYDVCERVWCRLTESRPPAVRRPGPSQIKMYGFCRLFRAMFSNSEGRYCTMVWQKIRSVSHFLQPPAIDKASEVKRKKSMLIKWRVDWREIESTHYVTIISARNTGTSTVFRAPFSTTFRWRIFSNQRDSISWCPKSPFPSKTQNRPIARTSPLKL